MIDLMLLPDDLWPKKNGDIWLGDEYSSSFCEQFRTCINELCDSLISFCGAALLEKKSREITPQIYGPKSFDLMSRSAPFIWNDISIKAGVINACDFGKLLEKLTVLINQQEVLRSSAFSTELRRLKKEFRTTFPRIDRMRDAVVHPELYVDPNQRMQPNELAGEIWLRSMIGNGQLTMTFKGQRESCRVDTETAKILVRIFNELYENAEKLAPTGQK